MEFHMHIKSIEDNLHEGFHDSKLYSYTVDYVNGQLSFQLGILCYDDDDEESMHFIKSNLFFYNALYFVSDFPWPGCFYESVLGLSGGTTIDIELDNFTHGRACQLPRNIPDGFFTVSLFMGVYNSHLYFAANDATLEWTETPPRSLRNIKFA